MSDEIDPNHDESAVAITFVWLVVGLAPTFILLGLISSKQTPALVPVFVLCLACNLVGGFGCTRRIQSVVARIFLGLLLAGFFFALSCIVAIFQACAHMNF